LRQSGRDRFALKDMLRFALKDLLRGATTPLRVYWDVKKLLDESSFFVEKREILICRGVGDGPKSSLPLWGRWISRKMLALFRERRKRSLSMRQRLLGHRYE